MAAPVPTGRTRVVNEQFEAEFEGVSLRAFVPGDSHSGDTFWKWTAWYRELANGHQGTELVPGTLEWVEPLPEYPSQG